MAHIMSILKDLADLQSLINGGFSAPTDATVSSLRRPDSQSPDAHDAYQDTQLCRRCTELNFESWFNPPDEYNHLVSRSDEKNKKNSFGIRIDRGAFDSNCKLCNILEMLEQGKTTEFTIWWQNDIRGLLQAAIASGAPVSELITHWFWITWFPGPRVEDHKSWPLDPAKVDFGVLKAKFEHCKTHHANVCRGKRVPVDHLRVVNCVTGDLEDATDRTKYAALSYVWGHPQIRSKYPQTILDAFEVAQKFGLKYIWVDQLCIDQGGSHKADQIRQMHNIYGNAELTIVAAAGCDSNHGLPGVNGTPRKKRGDFKIGAFRFVDRGINTKDSIKRTTWAKRGWTYQEELLSNRLVTFTDREAWFSCWKIDPKYGREPLDQEDHSQIWGKFLSSEDEQFNLSHQRNIEPPYGIFKMILDYSGRTLTKDADIIDAFSGCLGALERADPPVYQLWGSPIPLFIQSEENNDRLGSLNGFLMGLQWTLYHDTQLKRRTGFPSWSWTGWIGPVRMRSYEHVNEGLPDAVDASASLELKNGKRLDWSEFEERLFLKDEQDSISRFIHICAWTIPMRLKFNKSNRSPRAVTNLMDGREITFSVSLLKEEDHKPSNERIAELTRDVFIGVILTSSGEGDLGTGLLYIMLVNEADGHYERFGFLDLLWNEANINTRALQFERKEIRLG